MSKESNMANAKIDYSMAVSLRDSALRYAMDGNYHLSAEEIVGRAACFEKYLRSAVVPPKPKRAKK